MEPNNEQEQEVARVAVAAETSFFEGTEKLLEVWFTTESGDIDADVNNLRNIPLRDLKRLCELVHCEIISSKSDDYMDSYLLSESSMFVSSDRFILKTCGTTSLLMAMAPLVDLVAQVCKMTVVNDLFYSRKTYSKPELQPKIHSTFKAEMDHLDNIFKDGIAYTLGRLNNDSWYLYTLDRIGVCHPDQTLEVIMQQLDPYVMNLFTKQSKSSEEATRVSGISSLIPGMVIDDFLFDPCGYSMNGLLPKKEYVSIHITPEEKYSYVSFETNYSSVCYLKLIKDVLAIFKPKKFLTTIFANKGSNSEHLYEKINGGGIFENYSRIDHQYCQFKNYNITYTSFNK